MFEEYPDAAGFLSALRDAPDDATTRLVFADWLDERGDARAAWLREETLWVWLRPDCHDPVPALLAAVSNPDGWRLWDVLKLLGPPANAALRAWTRAAPGRWGDTRWALEAVRPPDLRSVPELIAALADPSPYECWQAVIDLGFHGTAAAPAVTALCHLDDHYDFFGGGDHHALYEAAIAVLSGLGPAAVSAIPYLYGHLDSAANVCEAAQAALTVLGPHDPAAMLAHVRRVDSDYYPHRALSLLADVHPEGLAVLARILRREGSLHHGPALVAMLLKGDPEGSPVELTPEHAAILVPALIEAFERPLVPGHYEYDRREIVEALAALGEPARAAIPALRTMLAQYDIPATPNRYGVREAIATALAQLGDTETGLAALLPTLADANEHVRNQAVERLARITLTRPEALPHLLGCLNDPSENVRARAVSGLVAIIGSDSDPNVLVPPLLTALTDSASEVRQLAVAGLARLKGAKPNFLLQMTGRQGRQADAFDSGDRVEIEDRAVAALAEAVDDPDESVRTAAVEALGRWSTLPAVAVDPLLRFVTTSHDDHRRVKALGALRAADEFPDHIVPLLIGLFTHRNDGWEQNVAGAAADLLTKVGAPAVPALIAALDSANDDVVTYAIRALDDMGEPAAVAVLHLLPFAADPEASRRAFVINILGQMLRPDLTLATFRRALTDPDENVRCEAAKSINQSGHAAADAIPDLVTATRDASDSVRYCALAALVAVGAGPEVLRPVAIGALAYTFGSSQALYILRDLGSVPAEVVPTILTLCQDADQCKRAAAIRAAGVLAPPAQVLAVLPALLDDPEETARDAAEEVFVSLGAIAAEADPERYERLARQGVRLSSVFLAQMRTMPLRQQEWLIPSLREALATDDDDTRRTVALTLRAIGPAGEAALREALVDDDPQVRAAAEFGLNARE